MLGESRPSAEAPAGTVDGAAKRPVINIETQPCPFNELVSVALQNFLLTMFVWFCELRLSWSFPVCYLNREEQREANILTRSE